MTFESLASESRREQLRRLLSNDELLVLPGVYDAFSARIAEQAGFGAIYLGSGNFTASHLGVPDLGLLSLGDMLDATRRICGAVQVPVVIDIDTGYGGPFEVAAAAPRIADAGAAGVQIEDQRLPKRCGHLDGKQVLTTAEMCRKIEILRRFSPADLTIIARTDAIAVEGIDSALRRAKTYGEAGADLLFVEAPTTTEMLKAVAEADLGRPAVANLVFGGTTPVVPTAELAAMGFGAVIFAGAAIQAAGAAVQQVMGDLAGKGAVSEGVEMLSLSERTALLAQERWNQLDAWTNQPLDEEKLS